ncbi:hypothetical protein SAFG77S_08278 [Streptomyces afghaniensis]
MHAPGEVGLDVGEAVGEGEGELADGVRAGFGDVVAGDGHGIEVADLVGDEPLLDVGHHPQGELGGEQAGVLALVLLEDVGLHRAAYARERVGPQLGRLLGRRVTAFGGSEPVRLLVYRGVQEERQDRRRGSVDGHGDRGRGCGQVEAVVEGLHVRERCHRHPGGADLAVDVGAFVRVAAVERDRVEGGGQAGAWPSESSLKRRFVRNGSPSPASIRAGSSPSRLKGNTPAVKGK